MNFLYFILILSSLTFISSSLIDWNEYLNKFPHIQVNERSKENFFNNIKYIIEHNSQERSYKLGVTPFLHLSDSEWSSRFTNISRDSNNGEVFKSNFLRGTPSSWDWRDSGVVTHVKDQGQVGSCWGMTASETMETAWAIKSGELKVLSPQQLVSCSKLNHGINGGLPDYAYMYAEKTEMCSEEEYPYTSDKTGQNGVCHSCTGVVPKLKSYVDVKDGDETAMGQAVLITSLAIGIKADDKQFQLYKSGVLDYDCDSNEKTIDHAVVLEGYGTEDGKDYWLVRNSWGEDWGDKGYIKMVRGKCLCGLCHMASYPIF